MDAVDLAFAGITEQADLIRTKQISSRELVEVYLERIERLDPRLNAFHEVFAEEALDAASSADERVARGDDAPLLGVPVAFKDELDIAGRVAHHGSKAYDQPAEANAVAVQRILDAGAITLGTTNLPELAICGFTESEASGDTRNPWDPGRTPGGSSGGSAAAVAAGLVGAASASDGAGSIRIPGSLTGLFGLKPQRGRISLMPEAEHWYGMSVTGCLTRRVVDTALWLDIAQGPAPGDAHTPPRPTGTYMSAAMAPPTSLRIGTAMKPVRGVVPPIMDGLADEAMARAATALTGLGHRLRESKIDYGNSGNAMIALYLRGVSQHVDHVPHPELLEPRTRQFARLGDRIPERFLHNALRDRDKYTTRLNALFDDVDVLITPVTGTAIPMVGQWRGKGAVRTLLGMSRRWPFTAIWNYTGQPAATIPVGLSDDGLPMSVMAIAPPNREDLLLSLAGQLEPALGWLGDRPELAS